MKRSTYILGIASFLTAAGFFFKSSSFSTFLLRTVLGGAALFGALLLERHAYHAWRSEEKQIAAGYGFGGVCVVLAVLIVLSFTGSSLAGWGGYFQTNIFTGECILTGSPTPWYYEHGCDTPADRETALKAVGLYTGRKDECRTYCQNKEKNQFCAIPGRGFGGGETLGCQYIMNCSAITCE